MTCMRDIMRLREAAARCRAIARSNRVDAAIYGKLAQEIDGKIARDKAVLAARITPPQCRRSMPVAA
jgi:hypothetical protein